MAAVRQAAFYCYNAKLDAPSRYGLLHLPTKCICGLGKHNGYPHYFEVWDGAGSVDDFLASAESLIPKSVVDHITIVKTNKEVSEDITGSAPL